MNQDYRPTHTIDAVFCLLRPAAQKAGVRLFCATSLARSKWHADAGQLRGLLTSLVGAGIRSRLCRAISVSASTARHFDTVRLVFRVRMYGKDERATLPDFRQDLPANRAGLTCQRRANCSQYTLRTSAILVEGQVRRPPGPDAPAATLIGNDPVLAHMLRRQLRGCGWLLRHATHTDGLAIGDDLVFLDKATVGMDSHTLARTLGIPTTRVVELDAVEYGPGSTYAATHSTRELAKVLKRQLRIDTGKRSILLAEDSLPSQMAIRLQLEKRGHMVIAVDDGEAAVAAATERRFDMLLMDIQMPKLDGVAAIARIRRQPGPNQLTPIIALTGLTEREDIERLTKAGANSYLHKPIDSETLFKHVERPIMAETPSKDS